MIDKIMQQTILFKVPGRPSTRPIVILTGPAIGAQSSTPVSVRLSRTLSKAWQWTRCNCTPVRIIRALFSTKMTAVVTVIALAAMYRHILSIDSTIEMQRAVGIDALLAMPWGLVWAFRATRKSMEKGGEV